MDTTASPTLTLQAALSLGAAASPEAIEALAALAGRAGRQPYVADAIASGLAGRELDFIRRVCAHPAADNAAPAVTLAASAVLTSGDAERIRAVLAGLEGPAEFPAWGRAAVLAGVERFLPKTPDGRPLPGAIPVEPVSLLRLAARGGAPESEQAVRLATQSGAGLSLTFLVSFLVAAWSANAAVKALFDALNIIYRENEKRSFLKLNAISLFTTASGVVLLTAALTASARTLTTEEKKVSRSSVSASGRTVKPANPSASTGRSGPIKRISDLPAGTQAPRFADARPAWSRASRSAP